MPAFKKIFIAVFCAFPLFLTGQAFADMASSPTSEMQAGEVITLDPHNCYSGNGKPENIFSLGTNCKYACHLHHAAPDASAAKQGESLGEKAKDDMEFECSQICVHKKVKTYTIGQRLKAPGDKEKECNLPKGTVSEKNPSFWADVK